MRTQAQERNENMGVNKINSGKQAWSDWALASLSWPNYSSEDINIAHTHTHTRYDPMRMKLLWTFGFRGHGWKAPYADNMLDGNQELTHTHYCLSEQGLSHLLNNCLIVIVWPNCNYFRWTQLLCTFRRHKRDLVMSAAPLYPPSLPIPFKWHLSIVGVVSVLFVYTSAKLMQRSLHHSFPITFITPLKNDTLCSVYVCDKHTRCVPTLSLCIRVGDKRLCVI